MNVKSRVVRLLFCWTPLAPYPFSIASTPVARKVCKVHTNTTTTAVLAEAATHMMMMSADEAAALAVEMHNL
jgi:hypothetical protein